MPDPLEPLATNRPIALGYGVNEPAWQSVRRRIPRIGPVAWGLLVLAIILGAWFVHCAPVWSPTFVGQVSNFWVEGDLRMRLSSDEKKIAIAAPAGQAIIDLATGLEVRYSRFSLPTDYASSPKATRLDAKEPAGLLAMPDRGWLAALSPDGTVAAYLDQTDTAMYIRDLAHNRQIAGPIAVSPQLFTMDLSGDGRWIIAASRGEIWNIEAATGRPIAHTQAPLGCSNTMIPSPDGRTVVFDWWTQSSAVSDHVLIYDARALRQIAIIDGRLPVNDPFSPDSHLLAINNDEHLQLVDLATGQKTATIRDKAVSCMWMPDGSLMTLDWRGDVQHWSPQRPAAWWGGAVLPQFWLALVAVIACAWRWGVELRRWYRPVVVRK